MRSLGKHLRTIIWIAAATLALVSTLSFAQDAIFIESANALHDYLSLQSPVPVLKDKSSGTETADGVILWHPALDGEKGILFASFESKQMRGAYLRRKGNSLVVEKDDGSPEFAKDASFKVTFPGGGSLTLESIGRPGYFIRHNELSVVLEPSDKSPVFQGDTRYFRVPVDAR